MRPPEMVTLYRFYAADDQLLYVGITKNAEQRVRGHASKAHWWNAVASATFEHGCTRDDERTAIELERPLFNVEHTDRSDWVDTIHDAINNELFTDRHVIQRHFDETCRLRDRLREQLAEVDRRLDLLIQADRVNRRARKAVPDNAA